MWYLQNRNFECPKISQSDFVVDVVVDKKKCTTFLPSSCYTLCAFDNPVQAVVW